MRTMDLQRIALSSAVLLALVLSGGVTLYITELVLKVVPGVVALGAILSLLLVVGGQRKLAFRIYDGAVACMAVRLVQFAWKTQKPELETIYEQYRALRERGAIDVRG